MGWIVGLTILFWPGIVVFICHVNPTALPKRHWFFWPMVGWAFLMIGAFFVSVVAEGGPEDPAAEAILVRLMLLAAGCMPLYWLLFQFTFEDDGIPFGVQLWTAFSPEDPAEAVRRHTEDRANVSEYLQKQRDENYVRAQAVKMEQKTAEMEAEAEMHQKAEEYEAAKRHLDETKKRRWFK